MKRLCGGRGGSVDGREAEGWAEAGEEGPIPKDSRKPTSAVTHTCPGPPPPPQLKRLDEPTRRSGHKGKLGRRQRGVVLRPHALQGHRPGSICCVTLGRSLNLSVPTSSSVKQEAQQ